MIRKWLIKHWWVNEIGKTLVACFFGFFGYLCAKGYACGHVKGIAKGYACGHVKGIAKHRRLMIQLYDALEQYICELYADGPTRKGEERAQRALANFEKRVGGRHDGEWKVK